MTYEDRTREGEGERERERKKNERDRRKLQGIVSLAVSVSVFLARTWDMLDMSFGISRPKAQPFEI